MRRKRCVIVVGATSGLGYELTLQLLEQRHRVAALGREVERMRELQSVYGDRLTVIRHDVREVDEIPELIQTAADALGGFDALIYCAGVMPVIGREEFALEKDLAILDVNVRGVVAWCDLVGARFQRLGRGAILGVGSVAGERGRPGQPVYNASKAFLHVYLESLRYRLHRRGVRVATVKPGPMRTPMTAHLPDKGLMSVDVAAKRTLSRLGRSGEFYLDRRHAIQMAIVKRLPAWLMKRLWI